VGVSDAALGDLGENFEDRETEVSMWTDSLWCLGIVLG